MKSTLTTLLLIYISLFAHAQIDSLQVSYAKANALDRAENCNDIFIYYLEQNIQDSILKYFSLTKDECKLAGKEKLAAKANSNMAIQYNRMGLHQEAKELHLKVMNYYLTSHDTLNYAKTLNNLALVICHQNQYKKALQHLYSALNLLEKKPDEELFLFTQMNLGIVYYNIDNYDLALNFFKKSIKIAKLKDYPRYNKSLLNNIASVHTMKKNFDSARYYYQKSKPSIKDETHHSYSNYFNNLGYVDLKEKDYENALGNFEKALQIRKKYSEKDKMVSSLIQIAKLYKEMGDKQKAIDHFNVAYSIAQEIKNLDGISNISKYLADIYYELGRYQKSNDFLNIYTNSRDSILKRKYNSQIARMNTVYRLQTKIKENQVLKTENAIQETKIRHQAKTKVLFQILFSLVLIGTLYVLFNLWRNKKRNRQLREKNEMITLQNEELEEARMNLHELNGTKDKFFSIIAHDLINPFHVIISLTRILDTDFDSFSDEEKKNLLNDLHNTSVNTFSLLENLLNWSRSQRGQIKVKPQDFLVQDLVSECIDVQSGNAKMKFIKLESFIKEELMLVADHDILKICLCNLISNAIKFTPQSGFVKVCAEKEENKVLLSVSDTGVGIDTNKIDKLFDLHENSSSAGTNNEKGTGLGLILVKELVEKNKGYIHVESEVGTGSTFTISIPMAPY